MSLGRTLIAWIAILPLMVANGILRETALVPALGRRAADVASAALGIAIILVITWLFIRSADIRSIGALARTSIIWLVLTVAFEFIFGHYVDRKPWSALIENYAIWRGNLWPVVLATLLAAPFIWGRPQQ